MRLPLKHLRSTGPPTKGRSTILSISLRVAYPHSGPPLTSFLRKITHGGHLFVCSARLLGPCSEIDRRLRPTDVCSAATALTSRHRKNIIGFFPHLLLLCLLLPDAPPSYSVSSNLGTSPRAFYSSPVSRERLFGTLENRFYVCIYQFTLTVLCD